MFTDGYGSLATMQRLKYSFVYNLIYPFLVAGLGCEYGKNLM